MQFFLAFKAAQGLIYWSKYNWSLSKINLIYLLFELFIR